MKNYFYLLPKRLFACMPARIAARLTPIAMLIPPFNRQLFAANLARIMTSIRTTQFPKPPLVFHEILDRKFYMTPMASVIPLVLSHAPTLRRLYQNPSAKKWTLHRVLCLVDFHQPARLFGFDRQRWWRPFLSIAFKKPFPKRLIRDTRVK